jgi:ABC-type lipoprotein export system ATPase subunit
MNTFIINIKKIISLSILLFLTTNNSILAQENIACNGNAATYETFDNKVDRVYACNNQLVLDKLEIGTTNKSLVTIDNLQFNMGEIYAVTGKTSCGKSLLFSTIKGIDTYAKGKICYPLINGHIPKIEEVNEINEYFDYAEIIALDNPKAKQILKEFGIDRPIRDYQHYYYSHSEIKEILITLAIIKKPDILLIDIPLITLDREKIKIMQKIIKKELPRSLILIVDHYWQEYNDEHFFAKNLHFENGKIDVIELN